MLTSFLIFIFPNFTSQLLCRYFGAGVYRQMFLPELFGFVINFLSREGQETFLHQGWASTGPRTGTFTPFTPEIQDISRFYSRCLPIKTPSKLCHQKPNVDRKYQFSKYNEYLKLGKKDPQHLLFIHTQTNVSQDWKYKKEILKMF